MGDGGDAGRDREGQATTALRLGGRGMWPQGRPRSSANPGPSDATPLALGKGGAVVPSGVLSRSEVYAEVRTGGTAR